MQSFPETPGCDDSTDLTGHLWVQELPTGGGLRFRLAPSGALTFGTRTATSSSLEALPAPYRRGAKLVRERIDRDALQEATDDPSGITFFGVATWNDGLDYDWQALPPFVGVDVWSPTEERYLPPDVATSAFERLGLSTLPAIVKEQPVAHADLTRFTGDGDLPASAWVEGSAAGVLLRDKTGTRCEAWPESPGGSGGERGKETISADAVASEFATDERIEATLERLEAAGEPRTVATVRDRIVADVARERHADLYQEDEPVISMDSFASIVAERVQRVLVEKEV